MLWLSPSFPVGAFAYSHGLELASERGWVSGRETLEAWLADLARHGSLRTDLILVSAAWRAATVGDATRLADVNDIALALQPSAERHLESVTQGGAFLATMRAAWPTPALDPLDGDVAYPVAIGAACAGHGVALEAMATAYALAFAQNLVSAAIRLSLIGQTDGQRVIASLLDTLTAATTAALDLTLDDLGSATLRSDLASLAHETQYTRLFRS
ncbi:MAG: urease accessory UreF family protein [Hyphomicrobiaceae bacterium]